MQGSPSPTGWATVALRGPQTAGKGLLSSSLLFFLPVRESVAGLGSDAVWSLSGIFTFLKSKYSQKVK